MRPTLDSRGEVYIYILFVSYVICPTSQHVTLDPRPWTSRQADLDPFLRSNVPHCSPVHLLPSLDRKNSTRNLLDLVQRLVLVGPNQTVMKTRCAVHPHMGVRKGVYFGEGHGGYPKLRVWGLLPEALWGVSLR